MGFLFDTKKGETPETLKRQREIIRALMGAQRAPQNVGEGLSALGDGIVANVLGGRADRAEQAGMESAASAMGPLSMMFGGGAEAAGGTVAPSGSNYSALADGPKGQEAYAGFEAKAPQIISRLASDLGITPEAAAGVVGQLGHESEGLQAINERNPTVPGSRGGFGWAQWTGPRRKQFEQWSGQQGLDPTSDDANYGFLMHELKNTPEGGVLGDLKGAGDAQTAGRIFTDKFLRPGIPGYGSRAKWTDRALSAYQGAGPQPAVAANEAMANGQPVQVASLDPSSGVVQALAEQGIDPNGPQAQAFASLQQGSGQPSGPAQGLPPDSPIIRALMGQSGGDPTNPGGQFPAAPPQAVPQQLAQAGGEFPAAPPDPGSGEGKIRQLLAAAQNPWLSESQQSIVKALLGEEMQKRDPSYQMGLEKSQLELEALKNPKPEYGFITGKDGSIFRSDKGAGSIEQVYGGKPETFRTLTPEEEVQGGLDPAGAYQMGPDNKISKIGGEGTTVNIDQKAEGAFEKKLGEKQAETFDAMSTEGMNAKGELGVIGELDNLLKGQGGTLTGIAGIAAKYGLGGEGIGDLQATQAIINKLIPTQRQPGSGTMSDRDVEMFTRSLPSLWNQPGGNEKILHVMRGLATYKQAQGEIADQVLTGEISRQEARQMLRKLPNPLAQPEKTEEKTGTTITPGDTRTYGGTTYTFNGGDPADPQSWTK